MIMTMKMVNIHEAKARLSEFLDAVEHGQTVVICRRNQPVAELRKIPAARTTARPLGLARGRVRVPDSFFEPLPDAMTESFDGGAPLPTPRRWAAGERPPAPFGGKPARPRKPRR
jgi:antitoxin (DNA-binding transcriptional repressor) of toxin-antitoxin stability system